MIELQHYNLKGELVSGSIKQIRYTRKSLLDDNSDVSLSGQNCTHSHRDNPANLTVVPLGARKEIPVGQFSVTFNRGDLCRQQQGIEISAFWEKIEITDFSSQEFSSVLPVALICHLFMLLESRRKGRVWDISTVSSGKNLNFLLFLDKVCKS